MKIAVLGIGSVGGLIGAESWHFITRGQMLEAIRSGGLHVESAQFGDFTVRTKDVGETACDFGVMEAVIISCKGYSLRRRSLRHYETTASSMPHR